ncbi:VWA domain-containing protein [Methanosarcina sp. KYL-1]|nr:VWA domain-containing protein [Methanosarcina sp. KYL-1]
MAALLDKAVFPDNAGFLNNVVFLNNAGFRYDFDFLYGKELILLVPLALLVLVGLRKGINRRHLFIHALVAFLLVIALAAPYSAQVTSSKIDQSRITIISDESASMELLQEGVPEDIADQLSSSIPVTLTAISGSNTALGDAILQQASAENYVLVVSDGQSNSGTSVEDALSYCYKNNFPVAALVPETLEEDLSIEIEGENEVPVDNQAFFMARIRKSTEEEISYRLKITVDRVKVMDREITQADRELSIEFDHTFETLGPHALKATLHPATPGLGGMDYFETNNQYMKSIYVTPKPKVILVTDEPESPLANIFSEVYEVHAARSFNSLDGVDAVVIDNQPASTISAAEAETLRKFILNGGGLVVVGGDSSFDYPEEDTYRNTKFEELLPVTSNPSTWRGGRNIVLMLDVSPSTADSNNIGGRILDDILSNTIVLLESDLLKDARVDVITFGSKGQDITEGFLDMSKESNRVWLDSEIRKINPTGDSTSLEQGLLTARHLLEEQDNDAEADIIIVSDGRIGNRVPGEGKFEKAIQRASALKESGIGIYFVHIHAPRADFQVNRDGRYYADTLMNKVHLSENYYRIEPGQRVNIKFAENPEEAEDTEDDYSSGSVVIYDPKHFITRDITGASDVLAYNDVSPRPEANRLVITRLGKPVLTVWRLGLGRVAAITTDNGYGGGIPWAPALYAGNDSLLITRTMNWVVADTETGEDLQLKVPDLKMGEPGRILITTKKRGTPVLYFDRKPMEITSIGSNMYESYVLSEAFGLHNISETPYSVLPLDASPEEIAAFQDASWRPVSVNRPDEYTHIGENPLFKTAILENGGKLYTTEDIYSRIIEDSRTSTEKTVRKEVVYTKHLLILAFLIYLIYTLYHTYNTRMR